MRTLAQDVRHALRAFRRTPALTAGAVLSLAIGIGANSAIVSVARALLLRPLPYPQADRLASACGRGARAVRHAPRGRRSAPPQLRAPAAGGARWTRVP